MEISPLDREEISRQIIEARNVFNQNDWNQCGQAVIDFRNYITGVLGDPEEELGTEKSWLGQIDRMEDSFRSAMESTGDFAAQIDRIIELGSEFQQELQKLKAEIAED